MIAVVAAWVTPSSLTRLAKVVAFAVVWVVGVAVVHILPCGQTILAAVESCCGFGSGGVGGASVDAATGYAAPTAVVKTTPAEDPRSG